MTIFSKVKGNKPKTNTFDLSHDRKMSLNMGDLVPIHVMECVPGDKIKMSTSQMLRFAPMIAPVMHRVTCYTHFFFIPNRIVWSNWEKFITGGEDGADTTVFPTVLTQGSIPGDLSDYLGIPDAGLTTPIPISAIPFAAYQACWNEYYRDQNLVPTVNYQLVDGNNSPADLVKMRTRAWQHDYFTSALPWTQKGTEATIPLGTVTTGQFDEGTYDFNGPSSALTLVEDSFNSNTFNLQAQVQDLSLQSVELDVDATSINDLRRAFKLQEWLEKNARGGSRYIESILSHFGVRSSDARLQRPEFLGGGSSPVTISEVLQTSANATEPTPQGNMAGHGIAVGANNSFSYFCEEHGYIIGIMSIMPKTAYQQGVPKHFIKFDKFDYYWPSFANLGEQPIEYEEVYLEESPSAFIFGYTPRYAEYKFLNSSVHGEFRTSLDFWHMGRKFATPPLLNESFITCDPTARIFAVTDAEKIYAHVHHNIKASRPMPFFGTPYL